MTTLASAVPSMAAGTQVLRAEITADATRLKRITKSARQDRADMLALAGVKLVPEETSDEKGT